MILINDIKIEISFVHKRGRLITRLAATAVLFQNIIKFCIFVLNS